jgi:hypothetical protein
MKTIGIILMLIILNHTANAQYSMNTTLINYQEITNPISVNHTTIWDENSSFPLYFNFNFIISGQTYTALNVNAGGGLDFPGLGSKQLDVFYHPDAGAMLSAKGTSPSTSPIKYTIEGAQGSHILKIQWKNAGFKSMCGAPIDTTNSINYQIWLFEQDNHIEIHFGNCSASPYSYGYPSCGSDPNPGCQIKFRFDQCNNWLDIFGPCNLPSYTFINNCIWQPAYHLNGTPNSGVTFNIIPSTTGINEFNESAIKLYPNPVNDFININTTDNNFQIQYATIFNLNGEILKSNLVENNYSTRINIDNLQSGIYFLKIEDIDGNSVMKKFIKCD